MKPAEIRELSIDEIKKKLRDTRQELVELRVRKQAGQVEKPSELRTLRRDIARLETFLKAKSTATA
ncbi:50S ribosomal protein L29 [Ruficoccus amylovorans]|uniref:Large ribosomal subunit protein uL29 n=1 Tax=Ruficoccus amylovorans TaxID=1804625 RepID=A0A842HAG2_9BACT|nr:50S ribosomal protein L29 [Ruficoccus amylovorans]MBC2593315.1 50S ribosomal protein L29 [Ruficoccus amylovorans]